MREVLAPLGGIDSLFAALNAGAGAVYVGMKRFSARKNAENFSDEELKTAVSECHRRGARVYVTLNTLVFDSELDDLAKCIVLCAQIGVDGLIIQDLGAAELAKAICPKLPRHASTQMTLNSVFGVKAAEELGFSRVVIGRELSEREISHIAENTDAELEVFVHGALCACVSGQCYMSALFGGRSGNRGLCAQPCRLNFTYKNRQNVISLKDVSLIDKLNTPALRGVCSYKIEGRMKRPEYVACAVDACKKSLAGEEYDSERLGAIFSRGGFTDGYFDGSMSNMTGIRDKDDVMNTASAIRGIKEIYKNEYPRFPVNISVEIRKGEKIRVSGSIVLERQENITEQFSLLSEIIPENAVGKPLDETSVSERMGKFGGTAFYPQKITAKVDGGLYVSAGALNSLRREVCGLLESRITAVFTNKYETREYSLPKKSPRTACDTVRFRAEVADREQLNGALALDFELIYAPMCILDENTPNKKKIAVMPPLILSDCEEHCEKRLLELRSMGFDKALAQTLSHAALLKKCGFRLFGGYRMNILNSLSAKVCADFGFTDITLSIEGSLAALSEINSPCPVGIVAYGRLPLMLLRRCPIADGKPCGRKNALYPKGEPCGECIKDRRGNNIPVLCGGNSVELLNPDVLMLCDKPEKLAKFDFVTLKFTDEKDLGKILSMYKNGGKINGNFTRGLYFKGAE